MLLVSNQSFDVDPVDIEIRIDGRVVVQDEFRVAGDQLPQHNWQRHEVRLAAGSHRVAATSERGKAHSDATFEMPGIQTVTVAYWHGLRSAAGEPEGYFTIECRPGEVATM